MNFHSGHVPPPVRVRSEALTMMRKPGREEESQLWVVLSGIAASPLKLFICHMLQPERGSRLPLWPPANKLKSPAVPGQMLDLSAPQIPPPQPLLNGALSVTLLFLSHPEVDLTQSQSGLRKRASSHSSQDANLPDLQGHKFPTCADKAEIQTQPDSHGCQLEPKPVGNVPPTVWTLLVTQYFRVPG